MLLQLYLELELWSIDTSSRFEESEQGQKKVQKQSTMTGVYLRLDKYEVRKQCQTFHNGFGDFMKSYVRCSIWHFRFVLLNLKASFHQKKRILGFLSHPPQNTKPNHCSLQTFRVMLKSYIAIQFSNQYVEDLTKTLIHR